MNYWHAKDVRKVFSEIESSEKGLENKEAAKRLEKYGKNEFVKKKKVLWILKFLKQFNSPLIYILFVAAIISFAFDHLIDAHVILAVVLINASVGFIQERKAERAIDALKKVVVSYAKVYRGREIIKIPASQIVPGDVIFLEEGVNNEFTTEKEFIDLAKRKMRMPDWESIDLDEATAMISVFFARNQNKITNQSITEQKLNTTIKDMKFTGFADRIDFSPEGIEIIDYKTGKSLVRTKHRDFQLGYYAIAAKNNNLGKVKKVTLDMLKHSNPAEFHIDNEGNAISSFSNRPAFNIHEIEKEITDTAKAITEAYKQGFQPCALDKNCDFCGEYVY